MSQTSGNRQPLGMTPTIVTCLPLIGMVLPTTAAIAREMFLPNLVTDQRDRRGIQLIFFGRNRRPRIGCTPRKENARRKSARQGNAPACRRRR